MKNYGLFEEASFYNVGTICISFEKNCIDASNGLINECAVSFHEYFHLVQNVTTIFGLWFFLNKIELFEDYAYASRRCNDINKFLKPIKREKLKYVGKIEALEDALLANPKMSFSQNVEFVAFSQSEYVELLNNKRYGDYEIVKAKYKDEGHFFEYLITARSIFEAYSKSVEYEITEPFRKDLIITDYGQFEYYAVRLILEHFFPNLRENAVATILHWSLNHIMPSVFFKEIVLHLSCTFGQSLPSAGEISEELFEFYSDNYYEEHYFLLSEFKNKIDETYKGKDTFLGPILDDVYKSFKGNLNYLSDKTTVPCLELYPFKKTNAPSLMAFNTTKIPIPLYKPLNEDIFYSMSPAKLNNYIALDSLFFVLDKARLGVINYEKCPYCTNCTIPKKTPYCTKFLSKNPLCCHMGVALKYFL